MSLAFEDDKILTSNPFIDLLLYNLKVLSFNTIIKDQYSADSNETLESLKNSDLFLACYEKHAEVALFPYIPHDILVKAGVPENQIQLYENNDEYDPFYLPKEYHEAILKLAQPWFVDQYVEMNEYYRMIVGLPPLGDPGVPMRDYEYLLPDDLLDYTGEFVHETGTAYCQMLDNMGILDIIKADFPDAKYLDYVTKGLDIYTVRRKMDFQILYYPTTCDIAVTQEFLLKYEENRKYMIAAVYSKAMELESEYYHSFMIIYLVITVMLDMLMEVQSHIVKKDILDRRCIQYIFSIYGIPYYRVIPYKYQERMCKNVWSLVKYKSCTQEMLNIIDLFGFDDIHIFKYYLLKVRKTNAWGEYEYNETTKLVCRYNDIIEHTTLEEKMSSPSTQPPIPPNLDWYEKNGKITTFTRDRISNLYSFDDEENVISSTIEALDNSDLNDEYDNQNNQFISTRAAGDTVRYINYPFDYFLQKGNVMFVKLDGIVLVEGVDYTISNYNTITFHNNIANGKSKVTYEFYYDKETVDQDFKIDLDHAINMDVKQFKKCKKGQVFDLNPVKWYSYFPNENEVIVSVSSVWLPPALYSIDTENYTLTIDPSVSIDGRVVTVILLYSKALHTQFEKHNVTAVQDGQTDFFIPEPFQHYCLNENKFFITMGSVYVNQDRYTITASTQKNQSKISFKDGTRVERGRNLTFNFLYSTNAIWNPITLKTKTIHVVATEYYQSVFNIDFPVENYVDCRYKVFIKLLGWYLSETMFEIVGNTIVFMDQSIALQPGDEMDVILAYIDTDRSKGDTNIMVSADYRVADQDKQSVYDITFPTDHYHTKGNLLLVDVEGIYLTEGKDYTVNYNDAGGGRNGTVTLLTYDYKPMKGQRVNYTFYWDYEAEYYAMIDQQQIPIERKGQNTFTLEFPFFPYIQTGNSYIVMSGSTIVTPDRISLVDQFNIKIDGLDPEEPGGYITVLYIYNNYYIMEHEEDLIVEWIDAPVLSDQPYVEVPVPFENYIENDWPYFVTYGDRQWLSEDKYEIYDSSWYTDPVTDKSKYGSSITFTFIYLKREPWVVEVTEEDYKKDMDLYFSKIPLEDLYSTQYMKDPTNCKSYESITLQDGWWDGLYYKQNNHEQVIDDIYHEKWNYARSKYYGIFRVIDIVKYSSMISYFYSMLYDDVFLEEELKILVPSLSPYHKFRLADLFIYMTCLTYIFNEMEDFVLDQPDKIMMVQGFNFKASMTALKKYLRYHHEEQKKFDIWDFIIPTEQIPDLEEFMNILNTNWDVRQDLIQEMIDSEDYREYHIWKHIYDALMVWKLNFKFFTLENGKVATTYTEFLKEKDSVLYNSLQQIKAMGNYEEQQDYIVQIVDDIVYVLDEFINGEWKCVFDRFPGQSPGDALKYILLVISFFKSYKIVFLSKGIQMNIGQDGPDEDSFMKGMDLCRINKTDNIVTYYPLVEDISTLKHMNFYERHREHENGKWMREDFTLIIHTKNKITEYIEGMMTLIPTEFKKDIISGSLNIAKTPYDNNILEGTNVIINKEDYNKYLFDTTEFEYVQGENESDIDSDAQLNKELFELDLDSNNLIYNIGTIEKYIESEFEYEKGILDTIQDGITTIDSSLIINKETIDPNDPDYIINSDLNINKEYPSIDDTDYIINGDLNINKETIDPDDPDYIIDGDLNINKEYLEYDIIDGTIDIGKNIVDYNDPNYIIIGDLNINKEYITDEELNDHYTITGDTNIDKTIVDIDDNNYIIIGDTNIDKEYITEEELNDHYSIDGEIEIDSIEVDTGYSIDGNVTLIPYEVDPDDPNYIIDSNFELIFTEVDPDDDNYTITGEVEIDSEEVDTGYSIDGNVNINKEYITDEELDNNYTITGDLNIDKEELTEEELNDHYTIIGDLNIDKTIVDSNDDNYIIEGKVIPDLIPVEPGDEYDINSNVNIDRIYIENNQYNMIDSIVEIENSKVDEDDNNYIIDSNLEIKEEEYNKDIDSDLNINNNELDKDIPIEFNIDKLTIDEDIDSDLNINKENINTDIDSEVNTDKLEYNIDIDGAFEYIRYDYIKQNIISNYEFIYNSPIKYNLNKDIDSNLEYNKDAYNKLISGSIYYSEVNKGIYLDANININNIEFTKEIESSLSINKYNLNKDINISFTVEETYKGFNIIDTTYDSYYGTPIAGQQSMVQYPVSIKVDDITYLKDINNSNIIINLSNAEYDNAYVTNIKIIEENKIEFLVNIIGVWNTTTTYNCYIKLTDSLGYSDQTTNLEFIIILPEPLPGNIQIESSKDSDRRQLTSTTTETGYYFTTDYVGWDVKLNNGLTTDMIDLNNIKLEITNCSNTNTTNKYSALFGGTTDKGSNTLFGMNYTISDTVNARNQNYDYTVKVTISAKPESNYTGSLDTEFIVKLKIN